MKRIIFLIIFLSIFKLPAYEYIPKLNSFQIIEEEYLVTFDNVSEYLGDIYSLTNINNSIEWTLLEDVINNDYLENDFFYIKIELPDFQELLTDENKVFDLRKPLLIIQDYGHNIETYLNGIKIKKLSNPDKNKFSFIFIPLEKAKPGDIIICKMSSNISGAYKFFLSDINTLYSKSGNYSLLAFYEEGIDFIIAIIISIISIFSFMFYLFNRNTNYKYILWFSLFALLFSFFHAMATDIIITFIPIAPKFKELIEMAAFDLLSILLIIFYLSYLGNTWKTAFKILIIIHIMIFIINIFFNFTGYFLNQREMISFIYPSIEYIFIWIHLSIKVKNEFPSRYFRLAFITIALTYFSQFEVITGNIFSITTLDILLDIGLILFFGFLSVIPILSFMKQDSLIKEQNKTFRKFVPNEFLQFLSKEDITQIKLGDNIEVDITIMFADIRSFSSISEKMAPEQIFKYLNNFFEKVGPIIRKNGGFIDKYIGDAIMAIFPTTPKNALKAAVEIQKTLRDFNRSLSGFNKLKLGIGIHKGKTMLGIIGEEERIESTVISDTVNTASRLEALTKTYNKSIIFSKEVVSFLPENINVKSLGVSEIKGKEEKIEIFSFA